VRYLNSSEMKPPFQLMAEVHRRRRPHRAHRVRRYADLGLVPGPAPSLTPVFVPGPRRPLEALSTTEVPLLERVLTGLRNLPEVA
jgi:hypothetical protein